MAKPPTINTNLFANTDPAPVDKPKRKRNPDLKPIGVYLTAAEKVEIEALAKANGWTMHEFLQKGVRYFLARLRAGDIPTHQVTKTKTELD